MSFRADAATIFGEEVLGVMGETVTWAPRNAASSSISAIVKRPPIEVLDDGRTAVRTNAVEVHAATADVDGVARSDRLVFDAVTWTVVDIEERTGGITVLRAQRA